MENGRSAEIVSVIASEVTTMVRLKYKPTQTFNVREDKFGSITKLVGFRVPDIVPPAHVK